ncbi:MAG: SAM-dependent methyltransferase [Theionarchaea archaeon]|nr:SAM-dependent methyltransferase [Theionarchaea archaeon]
MKDDKFSLSAMSVASIRVVESYRSEEDRLFDDRFALHFLKPVWQLILHILRLPVIGTSFLALRERQFPGTLGGIICRTRFIDDALRDALEEGISQVVILGAGFDSRAYRIPGIDTVRVFEVDHSAAQAWKKARLREIMGSLPPHVTFVPMDFKKQDLGKELAKAGFRTDVQTFIIWEGVTQYIGKEAVDQTFQYVKRITSGRKIVFTYILQEVIDGTAEGAQKVTSLARSQGMPWIFGIDPSNLNQYLSERGFALQEEVGASEYQNRYLDPIHRHMKIFEIERTVIAQVSHSE